MRDAAGSRDLDENARGAKTAVRAALNTYFGLKQTGKFNQALTGDCWNRGLGCERQVSSRLPHYSFSQHVNGHQKT
jgi:hypothetical protein